MKNHPIFKLMLLACFILLAGSTFGFMPFDGGEKEVQTDEAQICCTPRPGCCPEDAKCIPIEECTPEMIEACQPMPGCCGK